jgi:hypothetical protein
VLFDKDVPYDHENLAPIMWTKLTRVPKNDAKPDHMRWRYLFETARYSFGKMKLDNDAIPYLEKIRKSLPTRVYPKQKVNPISASKLPQATQKAVIQQNLDVYKRKESDCDTILDYLKYELYGRRIRQEQRDLTEYQYSLVARLLDVADALVIVYARMEHPDKGLEEGEKSLFEQEAFYMRERDHVIELIQAELDRPITAADTPKPPESTEPTNPNASPDSKESRDQEALAAVKEMQARTGTSFQNAHNFLKESSWNIEIAVSRYVHAKYKPEESQGHPPAIPEGLPAASTTPSANSLEQLNMIRKFQEITKVDSDDALSFLEGARWDLEAAIALVYGDGEASTKPAAADDGLSLEQINAITRFVQATGEHYEVADDYLSRSNWDFDTAIKTHSADIAATQNTGLPSYTTNSAPKVSGFPDQLARQTAAIKDRPTNHIRMGDESSKRQAVSSPDGHDLIATLDERHKQNQELSMRVKTDRETIQKLAEQIMSPHPDNASKPPHINNANAAATGGNKLGIARILNPDSTVHAFGSNDAEADGVSGPQNMPTSSEVGKEEDAISNTRIVPSHTGLRIRVDSSNRFVSHVDPLVGTVFQQYQAMRRRLQIQYRSQQEEMGSSDFQHIESPRQEDLGGVCPGPSCPGEQCPGERDVPPDEPHEAERASQMTMAKLIAEDEESHAEDSQQCVSQASLLAMDQEIARACQEESDAQYARELAQGSDQDDIQAQAAHSHANWKATIRTGRSASGRKSPGNDSVIEDTPPSSTPPACRTRAAAPSPEQQDVLSEVLKELRKRREHEALAKAAAGVRQGKSQEFIMNYDDGNRVLRDDEDGPLLEREPPRPGTLGAEAGEGFEDGFSDEDAEGELDIDAETDDEADEESGKHVGGNNDGAGSDSDDSMGLSGMAGAY